MRVAYQGIKGAYSESAAQKHFGKVITPVGYENFEDVFLAVQEGKAEFGIIPVENTIAGSIAINNDFLVKYDLPIVAEVLLKIGHNLLGNPNSQIEGIKSVYSHPQAIEQCRNFLKKHKMKLMPEYDTAGAAKIVKERNNPGEAAIASKECAEIYGLKILSENIGSSQTNITRFFVVSKKDNSEIKNKTSIAFKTKHYPGALISCLQRLAKHNINLTKLESRPIAENPFEYIFFADFEGSINDENIKLALSEMEAASLFLKVIGSYKAGKID